MQKNQINLRRDRLSCPVNYLHGRDPRKNQQFKAKCRRNPRRSAEVNRGNGRTGTTDRSRINTETGLGSVRSGKLSPGEMFSKPRNHMTNWSNEVPTMVFIKAPRRLDYGSVAKIVDAVKSSGADPIALQVEELN